MQKILLLLVLSMFTACLLSAQTVFEKTYGGLAWDYGTDIQPHPSGGYLMLGYTESFGAGNSDFLLQKVDDQGNSQWSKTLGGTSYENIDGQLRPTSDGHFVVVGGTESQGAGDFDFYLAKVDTAGNLIWEQTYGGAQWETAYSVIETSDGGFAVFGSKYNAALFDYTFYFVKTDASGVLEWDFTYVGTSFSLGRDLVQMDDDGFLLVGETGGDIWVGRIDTMANLSWEKRLGGNGFEQANQMIRTSDGYYAISGANGSMGSGDSDVWLIKMDSAANIIWDQTYGGTDEDAGASLQETADHGFILGGETYSYGAGNGEADLYMIRTDSVGTELWQKTYGSFGYEYGNSVLNSTDGGFICLGYTNSFGAGNGDLYLIKTDASGDTLVSRQAPLTPILGLTAYPNPAKDLLTLEWEAGQHARTLEILNAQGQLIDQITLGSHHRTQLDVSHWQPGVYIARMDGFSGGIKLLVTH